MLSQKDIEFMPRENTVGPQIVPYAEFSGEIRSVFPECWLSVRKVPLLYRPLQPEMCTQNSGCLVEILQETGI